MSGDTATSSIADERVRSAERAVPADRATDALPVSLVHGLMDAVNSSLLVADRTGRILLMNQRARQFLLSEGLDGQDTLNLFENILKVSPKQIFKLIESGEHRVELDLSLSETKSRALVKWMPEPDWIVVQLEIATEEQNTAASEAATQVTVQELLQEREITYRNLLAAYLKLQEVNRQKTVFLASAAHELKTPLAVIKGYYDLLLTGSLGRLSDKQQDILEESKDSCETTGAAGVDVPELFGAGKRQTGLATSRKRFARLPRRAFEALVGSVPAKRRQTGNQFRSVHSHFPIRLPEGAAGGGKSSGQFAEAHARGRQRDVASGTAFLGTPRRRSRTGAGTPAIPAAAAQQRGSERYGLRSGHRRRASPGNF